MSWGARSEPVVAGSDWDDARGASAVPRTRQQEEVDGIMRATNALLRQFSALQAEPMTESTTEELATMVALLEVQLRALKSKATPEQYNKVRRRFANATNRLARTVAAENPPELDDETKAQMTQQELAEHQALLREEELEEMARRAVEMQALAGEMQGLRECMTDLATMTEASRADLDAIENDVDDTIDSASAAVVDLAKASKSSNSSWVKKVAVGVATVFGAVGLVAGPKGVVVGAGAGMLVGGAVAKRSAKKMDEKADAAAEAAKNMRRRDRRDRYDDEDDDTESKLA